MVHIVCVKYTDSYSRRMFTTLPIRSFECIGCNQNSRAKLQISVNKSSLSLFKKIDYSFRFFEFLGQNYLGFLERFVEPKPLESSAKFSNWLCKFPSRLFSADFAIICNFSPRSSDFSLSHLNKNNNCNKAFQNVMFQPPILFSIFARKNGIFRTVGI